MPNTMNNNITTKIGMYVVSLLDVTPIIHPAIKAVAPNEFNNQAIIII